MVGTRRAAADGDAESGGPRAVALDTLCRPWIVSGPATSDLVGRRAHPEILERLSGRRINLEEFVFFFTGKMPAPKKGREGLAVVPYVAKAEEMR